MNKLLGYCFILGVVIGIFNIEVKGQYLPQYSQFVFNQSQINPAYIGTRPYLSLEAHVRTQWLGLEGGPKDQAFSAHLPIPAIKSGVGINLVNSFVGAERRSKLGLAYSYHLNKRGYLLALGARIGLIQKYLRSSDLITPEGIYGETIDHRDDLLSAESTYAFNPDFEIGVYFLKNRLELGAALVNLLAFPYKLGLNDAEIVKQYQNFHFFGSYLLDLGYNFKLMPQLMVQTDFNNLQTTFGSTIEFRELIQLGFLLRGYNNKNIDALIGMLAYKVNDNLKLIYSYDYALSELSTTTIQSHELGIHYKISNFYIKKGGKILYNPRFL